MLVFGKRFQRNGNNIAAYRPRLNRFASWAGLLALAIGLYCFSAALSISSAGIHSVRQSAATIRIAVAQIGSASSAQDNLQKIRSFIAQASAAGCRVVVFPEGVLKPLKDPNDPQTVALLEAVQTEAAHHSIYVLLGLLSTSSSGGQFNWMVVIDTQGQEIYRYSKVYDNPTGTLPRLFHIDDIPCSAILCADRWLRGVADLPILEGAQISFELSDNFASEWVPELEWYWYVARALRHNVYVVFANTAAAGDDRDNCGRSAVVDPSGHFAARSYSDGELMLLADLDLTKATGRQAELRRDHAVFAEFWEVGRKIRDGEGVTVPTWNRYDSPATNVRIAAAQMAISRDKAQNLSRMEQLVAEAKANKAQLVVFPQLAVTGSLKEDVQAFTEADLAASLGAIQRFARLHQVYVIFGMPRVEGAARMNAAWVVDPDGAVLTQYDQMAVDRPDVFTAGSDPSKMWFKVNGVPAVVTVGNDKLWSEIAEMAAYAGVQLLFNLSYDEDLGAEEDLRQLQVASNFASFFTFSAVVNAASSPGLFSPGSPGSGGSTLWDDLTGYEEMQAATKNRRWTRAAEYQIFSSFSANCIVKAGKGEEIIYATRTVNHRNPLKEDSKNTAMRPWYWYGAEMLTRASQTAENAQ